MGPRSGFGDKEDPTGLPLRVLTTADPWKLSPRTRSVHRACRDSEQCHGPGCRVHTGKTKNKAQRDAERVVRVRRAIDGKASS